MVNLTPDTIEWRVNQWAQGYWEIPENLDTGDFDFDWKPHPHDRPYIHQFGTQWQKTGGPRFVVPNAEGVKYQNHQHAIKLPEPDKFKILVEHDVEFDYSWHPDDTEPAMRYVFGNQYYTANHMPTIEYDMPGAFQTKYCFGTVATVTSRHENWRILAAIVKEKFDFNWVPDPCDPPFIYVWGNQYLSAEQMPTVEYHTPGATQRKFMQGTQAILSGDPNNWKVYAEVDRDIFDFSWAPHPWDPPYIYVWGNQFLTAEQMPTVEYHVPGATERKYMADRIAYIVGDPDCWRTLAQINLETFDYDWVPHPWDPPYIYVWGNEYLTAEQMPTVEYHTPGATERKYMDDQKPRLKNNRACWLIEHKIDRSKFDWDWAPHPWDPPYIYTWGNQFLSAEQMPTVEYRVPGATERKYMNGGIAMLENDSNCWHVNYEIDHEQFDWTWCPHPWDPPYIYTWGNQYYDAKDMPTVEYAVPGASERKYMTDRVAFVKNDKSCWRKLHDVELAGFDWEWFPPTYEQPWIYTWGNQHHGSERMPTVEYHTPGATERKYMHDTVATLSDKMDNWVKLLPNVDFDWSWVPDPHDPPFIYVWGNQYYGVKLMPTLEYHVPGATERKYIHDTVATLTATETNWTKLLPNVDFDWSWIPHPHDPPYIYVWGNQYYDYTVMPTVEYSVPGATERKYMTDRHATLTQNREAYVELIPGADFDFSWIPDPREPAYIYVWGNQWHDAATEPTIEYHAPGATERKYMTDRVAVLPADYTNWSVSNFDDWNNFDFSWRPNPHSPPQIYQWADNGPRYTVPSATEVVLMTRQASNITSTVKRYYIETTLEDLIAQHTDEVFWALRSNIDYDSFNFNWRPDSSNFRHVNVFGNKLSADTQTYYINGPLYALGHRELNYINSLELSEHQDLAIEQRIILDMFYVELGTSGSEDRFAELKSRFPNIQKTRFLNSWRDTVLRCVRKAQTKFVWIVNSRTDYTDFQFDWYPADWQQNMLHVFGSQWSHWSNTYLVNAQTFERDTQYIEVIEHLSNINHVRGKTVPVVECVNDIVYIDMGNTGQLEQLQKVTKNVHVVPYVKSYLETLKSWLANNPHLKLKREYNVWITNSVSDYTDFDWSWYCDPFQRTQIHVFASGSHKNYQKFGDTLFVNLSEFSKFIDQLDQIENYSGKVNYIMHMPVPRLPHPVVNHDYDSHAQAFSDIGQHSWPYIELKTLEAPANSGPVPSVWGDMHDKILVGATGASQIIVPQSAFGVVRHEVYDYDRIETVVKPLVSAPLDIIFISNGEPIAEENYQHLVDVCQRKQIPNKIIRISNVDGRVASQHAAAAAAETRWYFLVNGKLRVKENFDWSWQPDRLQQPKHYIFTATNPVNGLEYGHQAIVANNRKLTLNTQPTGLDFTLSSLHESVEMNSGVALYNTDPWTTWRTAFRESIKLRSNTDDVSRYRLKIWTTLHDGEHGEWSVRGAQDGVAFWESVNGNLDELMQSYDWAWIREYYEGRYGK